MNKVWIEDGYSIGAPVRDDDIDMDNIYYLDILGLFETGWMIFKFDDRDHEIYYGYPC